MSFVWKDDFFFAKIGIFCSLIAGPLPSVVQRCSRSAALLKPNVANILLFNFCVLKFIQHGPITIANYASGPKSAPNSDQFWVRRLFNVCVRVFCGPNTTILLIYKPAKIKMSFIWKDDIFFAKIGIFCKSIALRMLMRSSKTGRKISSVTSVVWHVAPSCWNQMLPSFSSSNYVNKNSFNMAR